MINIYLLFALDSDNYGGAWLSYIRGESKSSVAIFLTLAIFHLIVTSARLFVHYKNREFAKQLEIVQHLEADHSSAIATWRFPYKLAYYSLSTILSLAGLFFSPLLYAVHILDVVVRSDDAELVWRVCAPTPSVLLNVCARRQCGQTTNRSSPLSRH